LGMTEPTSAPDALDWASAAFWVEPDLEDPLPAKVVPAGIR
jgi:hypothetical protein